MLDLNSLNHGQYIARTYELAKQAGERGDGPYGSLLVREDTITMEARNSVHTADDLASHPELILARHVSSELASESILYTSTEPCAMCSVGLCYASIGAVVYGVPGETAARIQGYERGIPCREVVDRYDAAIEVVGPVCPDAGEKVLKKFGQLPT